MRRWISSSNSSLYNGIRPLNSNIHEKYQKILATQQNKLPVIYTISLRENYRLEVYDINQIIYLIRCHIELTKSQIPHQLQEKLQYREYTRPLRSWPLGSTFHIHALVKNGYLKGFSYYLNKFPDTLDTLS